MPDSSQDARPPMGVRLFVFLLAMSLVGGGAYAFLRYQKSLGTNQEAKKAARPPALVNTTLVGRRDYALPVRVVGSVKAYETIDLSPNVTETVTELHFDDGDEVKKGQLLARLSDAEEEAFLASARATLAEEQREITRITSLVAEGAAAEARLAERQTLAVIAQQKILEAEAKLADRRIVAPFDGRLGLRRISVGALVSPGTVIATLDQIDVVKIDFSVPEKLLGSVSVGSEIMAHTETARDREFKGKIKHLDTRSDPVTRSVEARAEVPNPNGDLRPGMLALVELRLEPRNSLSVPERALVPMGTKQHVFVVAGTAEAPVARLVPIQIGRRIPGSVEVNEGLNEGDRIITDGLVGLQDGALIKLGGEYQGPVQPLNPERESP